MDRLAASLQAVLRAAFLVLHLALGLVLATGLVLCGGPAWYRGPAGRWVLRHWMAWLNRVLGVRVTVQGTPCPGPVLLVANHVSWLDVPALAAVCPAVFVSKAEVRRWPVLGWLAACAGTRFLQRGSLARVRRVVGAMARELERGLQVVVFPEGTTSHGVDAGPFRPVLLQAATLAGCPVQPVALRYVRDGQHDPLAPFVGNDTLLSHLWRLLRDGRREVQLHFCVPLSGAGTEPRALARESRRWIRARLRPAAVEGRAA